MDLSVLQRVALELDDLLRGGFINKIHQPLPREIVLRVRLPKGGEKKLVVSADPKLGRIHLTGLRIPNPPSPPRFCAFLRAHFQGSRILKVEAAHDDRVVSIEAIRGPEGARVERRLILELLGRDSNIILVDLQSNRIMDCLHRIPEKETGSRVVLPGCDYLPPPKHARSETSAAVSTHQDGPAPGIAGSPDGRKVLTATAHIDDQTFPSMNEAVDAFFSVKLGSDLLEGMRRALAAPLKARLRSLDKRLAKIREDNDRAEAFIARGEEGELLKANLRRISKGMDRIVVQDWTTGQDRTIELDPALDRVANMERIFRKSAKGKRGMEKILERLKQTLEEKEAAQDQLFFIESAKNVTELNELAADVSSGEPPRQSRPDLERKAGRKPRTDLFREFKTASGKDVFVGKSAAGNEYLVRKRAKKGDLWFHVKDRPGAHVLLIQRGKEAASATDMEFAAGLAVQFSRARGKGRVEVMVADVRDVGHPAGGVPGQVTVKNYKTVLASGEPD
ncbi:MAG: NFACT family protein [Desulfomonile tiedjei]|nr:NFACT family protein [Desulfomonile tiedjei]